ncbi:hypothetical protein V2O64_20525 [Verrucomicrobiaceae bacterium 227]
MIEPDEEWLELCRSGDLADLEAQRACLSAAGIEVSEGIAGTATNLGEVYGAWNDSPNEGVIKVRRRDFEKARLVLENEFTLSPLPDDHYLHDFSDAELIDLLADQHSWSAFDVSHAKRMAEERQLDMRQVTEESGNLEERRRNGKPAPAWLIVGGWLAVFAGGLIGVGIGWSLVYMEENAPGGTYPTYNERARETGKKMLSWGVVMMVVWYNYENIRRML